MAELFDSLPFENLYWNQMETIPVEELRALQTLRLRRVVERARELPLYKDFFAKNPISEADFNSPEDVRRLPLTSEENLLSQYPSGLWTVLPHEIAKLQAQKNALTTAYTRNDVQLQADLVARLMYGTGTRSNNFVQISMSYNRSGLGQAYQLGAEAIGAAVIPHGDRNEEILSDPIRYLCDFNATGICTDFDYLTDLIAVARDLKLPLKYAHIPIEYEVLNNRKRFQEQVGIQVWLNWSHPVFLGAAMANECYLQQGLHLQEDAFLFEVLDFETHEPVPDGEPGELVVTDLAREAEALLRFRTGCNVVLNPEPCACGRTGRRVTFLLRDPWDIYLEEICNPKSGKSVDDEDEEDDEDEYEDEENEDEKV